MIGLCLFCSAAFSLILLHMLILLTLIRHRKTTIFASAHYVLIGNLGLVDIVILSYNTFRSLILYLDIDDVVKGFSMKTTVFVSLSLGWFPSLFFNGLIALNRFLAVECYAKHVKIFTPIKAVKLVFVTYLVCLSMTTPILMTRSDVFACKSSLQVNRLIDTSYSMDSTCDFYETYLYTANKCEKYFQIRH